MNSKNIVSTIKIILKYSKIILLIAAISMVSCGEGGGGPENADYEFEFYNGENRLYSLLGVFESSFNDGKSSINSPLSKIVVTNNILVKNTKYVEISISTIGKKSDGSLYEIEELPNVIKTGTTTLKIKDPTKPIDHIIFSLLLKDKE